MAKVQEGDRVRILTREVSPMDQADRIYYAHMAGLTGTVANVYNDNEVAVNIDLESLEGPAKDVHDTATRRMQTAFRESSTEEQRKVLTKEEMAFVPHFVALVKMSDIEKA